MHRVSGAAAAERYFAERGVVGAVPVNLKQACTLHLALSNVPGMPTDDAYDPDPMPVVFSIHVPRRLRRRRR
jgi:hypothetical protein